MVPSLEGGQGCFSPEQHPGLPPAGGTAADLHVGVGVGLASSS